MSDQELRQAIVEAARRAADRFPYVRSVTLAGSFATGAALDGIGDIDTIVVVEELDAGRFAGLQAAFRAELEPIVATHGYMLKINPYLGPLKFNDPETAVLHLMVYTMAGHREHAIRSPFTCFDWQRSPLWHKSDLRSIYPVFGLQPRHFLSARRGAKDYFRDLAEDVVTYREPWFDGRGMHEAVRRKPMTARDRIEFAYHVMRFLMQNFLKLVMRHNKVSDGEALLSGYLKTFPEGGGRIGALFRQLRRCRIEADFDTPVPDLNEEIARFVQTFETQFRQAFEVDAVRHIAFRHAPTPFSESHGDATVYMGRTEGGLPAPNPEKLERLAEIIVEHRPRRVFSSPLVRAVESVDSVARHVPDLPPLIRDERLLEIDYGACEGLSVAEVRRRHPDLFDAWNRGEDPPFPGGGENTGAVLGRLRQFAQERWTGQEGRSLTCTHNVVLRCLVGDLLSVPRDDWYRLKIPHLAPIAVIATRRFGRFVELEEEVERKVFSGFFSN